MTDAGSADAQETNDRFLGGLLELRQTARGHRSGTDAVLLAAAAEAEPGETFIDVGAGVGAVGLGVALRQPRLSGILLETNPTAARLAEHNVRHNGFDDRVRVVCADLFDLQGCRAEGLDASATLVLTNPPFFRPNEVRSSTDRSRAQAHVLAANGPDHAQWLRRAAGLLGRRGRFLAIHRADVLPLLLRACEGLLGSLVVRAIQPRSDRPAHRILLGGVRGSRGPLTILPPLTLHDADGAFTAESEALHRGAPMRFWPQKNRPRRAGSST